MSNSPSRILPQLSPENEFFWTAGADGRLRVLRCTDCGHYLHPPSPLCPKCMGRNLAPEEVSGKAEVITFTINHQPWIPGFDPPYAIAIVELAEQKGLRLTTNIAACKPEEVTIGMKVRVVFEDASQGVFVPLFEPEDR